MRTALAVAILAVASSTALACTVCFPYPKATGVDYLDDAGVVVLARENPAKRFSFLAKQVLKGALAVPEVDLFLNSSDRRKLTVDPGRAAVLVHGRFHEPVSPTGVTQDAPATEDAAPAWRSLGVASLRQETLIRDVLERLPQWNAAANGDAQRAAFFMPYLADPERAIRDLAYLEVGQADYDLILKADRFVTSEEVQAFLNDRQYLEWHPLYILLLGVNADEAERAYIRQQAQTRLSLGQTINLSAWITAYIEADGETAIDWIERTQLNLLSASGEVVVQIFDALSVHGNRTTPVLRDRITRSYDVALSNYPVLAGRIAKDMALWRDWTLAETVRRVRTEFADLDNASAYAIDYYLGSAETN
ncbi:MAG: hypothetical protein AAGD13_24250 [Pseudomonadota bacterium]